MRDIRRVGVVGGGLMGSGIAQVAAQAGFEVVVRELSDTLATRARAAVERSLDRSLGKGTITAAEREATLARLRVTASLDELASADIVIEAVVEQLEVKNALWRALDAAAPAHVIFASNTSSLTIAAMAAAHGRPDRMVGLHFFNPVPAMKLVEVVRAITTSDETFDAAFRFARALGKEPIAARDQSGFVVNLLLIPYLLDAIRTVERRVASVADIDTGMTLGTGHPMGPLALCDFVGLDTLLSVANVMFDEYREARYAPPPLLRQMVLAGRLGRKGGMGFYDYAGDRPVPARIGY